MDGNYLYQPNILLFSLQSKINHLMAKKPGLDDKYIQDYRESIGQKLRSIRELRGYSQDDLAEIMNVHRSTISKIETGKFSVTIDYLVKFSWHLDFDISIIEKK